MNCRLRNWRRTEKIIRTDHVKNEVLQRVEQERNIINTIKRRKPNWIGHILHRDCLCKTCYWRNDRGMERRERRPKQLMNEGKENRLWLEIEREALDRTLLRTGFRRGCGLFVRQIMLWWWTVKLFGVIKWITLAHDKFWRQGNFCVAIKP